MKARPRFAARGVVVWDIEAESAGPRDARPRWSAAAPGAVELPRPGIYKVDVTMFCTDAPALALLVNGAPAVSMPLPLPLQPPGRPRPQTQTQTQPAGFSSAGAGAPAAGHAGPAGPTGVAAGSGAAVASGELVLHQHASGAVAGTSLSAFVALPRGARLSVLFAGAAKGQGMLIVTKV